MAGENQQRTLRKSIAAQQPAPPPPPLANSPCAPQAPSPESGDTERVALKKEIGLVSACAIIVGEEGQQSSSPTPLPAQAGDPTPFLTDASSLFLKASSDESSPTSEGNWNFLVFSLKSFGSLREPFPDG
uniref:Uncharacterized protein n=1 Tax=Naja naja TaxID=35670 RepID=A0A8C6Y7D4_NAJNA